jgi:GT2 family glycosyltransferase
MTVEGAGPRVVLAISSFRNDDDILRLLTMVQELCPSVFDHVLVVDSLGTGRLPTVISERGWTFARYEAAASNLGSAGNLTRRLQLAADSGADFVYCLNHDGILDSDVVRSLVRHAAGIDRVGAVYPLRRITAYGGRYDLTGVQRVPRPFSGQAVPPTAPATEVYWSSSNGALYALEPVRDGLQPWADLWMGWEDLGYGWLLHEHGYRQVVLTEAVIEDNYEYRAEALGPVRVRVSDKPLWYTYYRIRNLILVTRRVRVGPVVRCGMALRVLLDFVPTVVLRSRRQERFGLYVRGFADGLRGTSGKWRLP